MATSSLALLASLSGTNGAVSLERLRRLVGGCHDSDGRLRGDDVMLALPIDDGDDDNGASLASISRSASCWLLAAEGPEPMIAS